MRRTVVVVLLVVAGVSGCGSAPTPAPPAQVARTADCLAPQVVADLGLRMDTAGASASSHPDAPAAGAVPDGFVPSGVLVCESGERLTDADGIWEAVTERRLEGDMGPLLAALAEPSEPAGTDPSCVAVAAGSMQVWLVDALGQGVRALAPVDACGVTRNAVTRALARLDEIEVTHFPVHLAAARASATTSPTPTD